MTSVNESHAQPGGALYARCEVEIIFRNGAKLFGTVVEPLCPVGKTFTVRAWGMRDRDAMRFNVADVRRSEVATGIRWERFQEIAKRQREELGR